jgi:hypothetical protein
MISGDLTVARVLDLHPELVEVLAGFHPHFGQLRRRILRKVMAPRVTLAQAAGIAGVPVEELLTVIRQAVGDVDGPAPAGTGAETSPGAERAGMPPALAAVPADRQVHLDVRDDIGRGEEPFARIMAAVKGLRPDEVLVLRVPFEPIPLYDVLGRRGLAHWTAGRGPADWSVWFYGGPAATTEG